MRRVITKVSDPESRKRLEAYLLTHGVGPHHAATLADRIWLDAKWTTAQGAGAAASRVLKRLGCYRTERNGSWGWMLNFPNQPDGAKTP